MKIASKLRVQKKILRVGLLVFLVIFFGINASGLTSSEDAITRPGNGNSSLEKTDLMKSQLSDMLKTENQTLNADHSGQLSGQLIVLQMESYTVTYRAGQHGSLSAEKLSQTTESVVEGQTPASAPAPTQKPDMRLPDGIRTVARHC